MNSDCAWLFFGTFWCPTAFFVVASIRRKLRTHQFRPVAWHIRTYFTAVSLLVAALGIGVGEVVLMAGVVGVIVSALWGICVSPFGPTEALIEMEKERHERHVKYLAGKY